MVQFVATFKIPIGYQKLVMYGLQKKLTGEKPDLFGYPFSVKKIAEFLIEFVVYRKLPFKEKHVIQQASILGNLEEIGVLKDCAKEKSGFNEPFEDNSGVSAVVEFGAGRGYLTQMLADCYGIKRVFLVERKAYKLKVS